MLSLTSPRHTSTLPIGWKDPQNDRARKSRFNAPNFIRAGNRHDKVPGRATRDKIAHGRTPAEFSLRSIAV